MNTAPSSTVLMKMVLVNTDPMQLYHICFEVSTRTINVSYNTLCFKVSASESYKYFPNYKDPIK